MINFQLAGKLDLGNKVVIKQNYFSVSYAMPFDTIVCLTHALGESYSTFILFAI